LQRTWPAEFTFPAPKKLLEPAIQVSLDEGRFEELDSVRHLPGMTRAVAQACAGHGTRPSNWLRSLGVSARRALRTWRRSSSASSDD
jgi:hypothetical protein